ncbi:hypothetical protein LIER_34691 [Lithospermum erythrorhizon]|uniref:Uncharacterized protein n=1 Tax=Lithospermum erythrorhizon TaxID=34254 RepID=A0AAV3S204_LITER
MASLKLTYINAAAIAASQLVHKSRLSPFFLKPNAKLTIFNNIFAAKVPSSSTAFVSTQQQQDFSVEDNKLDTPDDILACPICYEPLIWKGSRITSVESIAGSSLLCGTCKKSYLGNESHIDLTLSGGGKKYSETTAASTEFFRYSLFPLPIYINLLVEACWSITFLLRIKILVFKLLYVVI